MPIHIDSEHPIGKLANFRDLGGIHASSGLVKHGLVYRADDLATIDAEAAQEIFDLGVTNIIDLRSPEEVATSGRGPLGNFDITYTNLPLMIDPAAPHQIMSDAQDKSFTDEHLGIWYDQLLGECADLLKQGLEIISEAKGGTIFHCAAGKDRTGIFAASLLTVLDVDDKHIVSDYATTHEAMPAVLARLTGNTSAVDIEQLKKAGALLNAMPIAMETLLQRSNERDGGILNRLKNNGVDDALIQKLRTKLLE